MAVNIGLDIGAIGLKLAALGREEDRGLLAALCAAKPGFRFVDEWTQPLVVLDYVRIAGSPIQAAYDILHAFYESVPETRIEGIRVTGSGSRTIARILGIYFENEFKAAAHMVARFYPETRTIFEIGGESSRYIRLGVDEGGGPGFIADYDHGGECAAGTGSFLDQQASRLGYAVEEMSDVIRTATASARIAGRCSVFAKSDMIHAQQKGCSPAEILRGLCRSVAQQFQEQRRQGPDGRRRRSCSSAPWPRTQGVVEALRETFDLDQAQLVVPPLHAWCGAIGAAMLEADETEKRSFGEIHRLHQHASRRRPYDGTPLTLDRVVRLPDGAAGVPGALGPRPGHGLPRHRRRIGVHEPRRGGTWAGRSSSTATCAPPGDRSRRSSRDWPSSLPCGAAD